MELRVNNNRARLKRRGSSGRSDGAFAAAPVAHRVRALCRIYDAAQNHGRVNAWNSDGAGLPLMASGPFEGLRNRENLHEKGCTWCRCRRHEFRIRVRGYGHGMERLGLGQAPCLHRTYREAGRAGRREDERRVHHERQLWRVVEEHREPRRHLHRRLRDGAILRGLPPRQEPRDHRAGAAVPRGQQPRRGGGRQPRRLQPSCGAGGDGAVERQAADDLADAAIQHRGHGRAARRAVRIRGHARARDRRSRRGVQGRGCRSDLCDLERSVPGDGIGRRRHGRLRAACASELRHDQPGRLVDRQPEPRHRELPGGGQHRRL